MARRLKKTLEGGSTRLLQSRNQDAAGVRGGIVTFELKDTVYDDQLVLIRVECARVSRNQCSGQKEKIRENGS